jgi:PKD repeat protein
MRYMKAKKLATGMLVAVLLLSSLALLPSVTVKAAGQSALVSFNVVDVIGNAPVVGATATLTETHTSLKYTSTSDAGGLVTFSPVPGYYILRISKVGFYDLQFSQIVKVDGINPVQFGQVGIQPVPSTTGTLSVTVTSGGNPVNSVTLKTIDISPSAPSRMEKIYTFNGATSQVVYSANYRLVTSAPGFETDVRDVSVGTGITSVSISLNQAVTLSGFVFKANSAATNVAAVLVSSNTALPVEKRIIQGTVVSNFVQFDAFADSNPFWLMVDATDARTNLTYITLLSSQTLTVNLVAQSLQTDVNDAVFANNDWNNFKLTRNITMDFDASWANIAYSFIPNLRMQIDFAFGNGNGVVETSEYNAFVSTVNSFGPVNVTSAFILKVNSTQYTVLGDMTSSFTGISGASTTSVAAYTGSMAANYRSIAVLVNSGTPYNAQGFCKYETNSVDYKLLVTWPRAAPGVLNYEMTSNTTQTTSVKVSGFTTVTIDTLVRATPVYEQVSMVVQKAVAPSATAGVGLPSDFAYAVTSGSSILYYIVAIQKNIVFTANGSADPNRNPLKFTWNFGDGSSSVTTSSYWTTYSYATASFNRTVTMTVTDVAQKTAVKVFYVKCDGIDPVPQFVVQNKTISAGVLNVNQFEAVKFNAATSFDHIASTATSDVGIIRSWKYVWGDGNTTTIGVGENQNVTKTYARAGTFTMYLNTTDAAGHVTKSDPISVVVKDKTPPVVSYVITYNGVDAKGTAVENQTLGFSGNLTTDNYSPFSTLAFSWNFGDGTYFNGTGSAGAWTTHKYQKIAKINVKLTVTDPDNNSANLTKPLTITSQPRPDLRLVSMVFDPTTFTEGSAGKITVNITNVGNDVAVTPYVNFYYLNADGSRVFIGKGDQLFVKGVLATQLKVGESGLISITWSPGTKGNYTILANAITDKEINTVDNTITKSVNVNEAAWKSIALYGGIFAVIVVVIVLYYFRKRLPKVGGGKKSEKEEKQPSKQEKSERGKK